MNFFVQTHARTHQTRPRREAAGDALDWAARTLLTAGRSARGRRTGVRTAGEEGLALSTDCLAVRDAMFVEVEGGERG